VVLDHPLSPRGLTLAVLDTNTILSPRLSDVLFDLHGAGLYFPRWTADIESEFLDHWAEVVLAKSKADRKAMRTASTNPDHLQLATRRLKCFRAAVGVEYEVFGHHRQSVADRVPEKVDKGDKHLIAAALVLRDYFGSADRIYLVSNNTKHLAVKEVAALGIEVVKPGKFVDSLFVVAPDRVAVALERTINDLKNPPYTKTQLLDALELHGASKVVSHFAKVWHVG
jgi:hypothetical protein